FWRESTSLAADGSSIPTLIAKAICRSTPRSLQSVERIAPRVDLAELAMPPAHIWKLRQWQARGFRERQRRRDPEVGVRYPISENPGAIPEMIFQHRCVLPKITKRLVHDGRIGLFVRKGRRHNAVKIEWIGGSRQVIGAPADPHHHLGQCLAA